MHALLEAKAGAAGACEKDINMHLVRMQADNACQGRQCPSTVLCVTLSDALGCSQWAVWL